MKHLSYFPCIAIIAIIFFNSCSKQENIILTKPSVKGNSLASGAIAGDSTMVFTPFGPRLKADIHLIPNGHRVGLINGHMDEIDIATGKVINDFGVPAPLKSLQNVQNGKAAIGSNEIGSKKVTNYINTRASFVPASIDSAWKTWAESTQTKHGVFSTQPFPQSFSTSYTVPALPSNTTDGQVIFIFNGLEDNSLTTILQPVLQYGSATYYGSSTTWQLVSYYISSAGVMVSAAVPVSPGDNITGEMQETGTAGSNDWTSYFYKNNALVSSLPVTAVYPLTTLFETLEADDVSKTADYPPQDSIAMTATAGEGNPVEIFTPSTNSTAVLGEHPVIPNPSQVDLYFRAYTPPPPPPITIAEIDCTAIDTAVYWLKNGTVSSGTSTNATAFRSPTSYTLPSGETPSDIVGIGVSSSNKVYYYYLDGTFSVGSSTNATSFQAPESYTVAAGETISNILGISVDKSTNYVYTWYKDGTISQGNSLNLGLHNPNYGTFTVAAGESISTVVGIGIAGNTGYCHVWYSDQTTSTGTLTQFDYYSPAVPCTL